MEPGSGAETVIEVDPIRFPGPPQISEPSLFAHGRTGMHSQRSCASPFRCDRPPIRVVVRDAGSHNIKAEEFALRAARATEHILCSLD